MEEKIIFSIHFCEEDIQIFSKDNFGRKLTASELNQMAKYWWENPAVFDTKIELLGNAIKAAIKTIPRKKTKTLLES